MFSGTGGAGNSRWDAPQCRWRGFQPARSCPGIPEHRARSGRVLCPEGSLRRHWQPQSRALQRCPRLVSTGAASFCLIFIYFSFFPPLALSPLALSPRMVLGCVSGVTAPQQSPPLSRAQRRPQEPLPGHGQGKTRKKAQEKMVQKRQNTEMVTGDVNFFPLFLSALTFQVSDTNGLWWKGSK